VGCYEASEMTEVFIHMSQSCAVGTDVHTYFIFDICPVTRNLSH
jgi:hypothetical protein